MYPNISILNASWDGLNVKYVNLGIPPMQEESLIIGIAIHPINNAHFDQDWLNGAYINLPLEYLLFTISPFRFEQLIAQTRFCVNKLNIHQVEIIDPSMLYMASLLITEIEYPKPLSQQFAFCIAEVIVTHCLLCLE